MLRWVLAFSIAMAGSGCAPARAIETLYTQGEDLDLYRSLADLGAMVRAEDGCNGLGTRYAGARWQKRYYPREEAIRARLEGLRGPTAPEGAHEINVHPRCGEGARSHYWRLRYEAVLITLERRLGLASTE